MKWLRQPLHLLRAKSVGPPSALPPDVLFPTTVHALPQLAALFRALSPLLFSVITVPSSPGTVLDITERSPVVAAHLSVITASIVSARRTVFATRPAVLTRRITGVTASTPIVAVAVRYPFFSRGSRGVTTISEWHADVARYLLGDAT